MKNIMIAVGIIFLTPEISAANEVIKSEAHSFTVETIIEGLSIPRSLAFLSRSRALVTERRGGGISYLNIESGELSPLGNVPAVLAEGGSGMHDVILHPNYANNGWIYFAYSVLTDKGSTLIVERAKLTATRLIQREQLFVADAYYDVHYHFGAELVIQGGYLFISTGDRRNRDDVQSLGNHVGKVIRLHDDGRIPDDNPYVSDEDARPEIWTSGHRNPQGMVLHPETGELWLHEHGPQGGDEINIVKPGSNYGWPVITYGEEYGGGPVGEGLYRKAGMQQPLYYYTPSIAPSGMSFYTADVFPKWQGNLFIGALGLTHMNRLVIEDNKVIHEERLLDDKNWRIRFIEQGPDGMIYFGSDDGAIRRISPAPAGAD
ncbi:MAG: PQQ-dependent sugar dehydrogenase [Gammaproteobacteria bacterium]|nr:PQQ-dependent sugar dehydrogenase [Gammaproteobacteria bacterium]